MNEIDPVIRSAITNRLTALGGKDITDLQFRYKLGDEALLCLLDIKQYVRDYDSSWEVSLAIAETNLVAELVQILVMWNRGKKVEARAKKQDRELTEEEYYDLQVSEPVAVLCMEILTHLTDIKAEKLTTRKTRRSKPKSSDDTQAGEEENIFDDDDESSEGTPLQIKMAQYKYKREVLGCENGAVLKAIIRLALPILKSEQTGGDKREHQILGVALRFFKNILAIEIGGEARLGSEQDLHHEISRSATIKTYEQQQVFGFLLSICAGLKCHAEIILSCIYHIVRGVDVTDVFPTKLTEGVAAAATNGSSPPQPPVSMNDSLEYLLSREQDLLRKNISQRPTRHTRFGALTTLQNCGSRLVISGEMGLKSLDDALVKLNDQKTWTAVKTSMSRAKKALNFEAVFLTEAAREVVSKLISQLLDGTFHFVAVQVRKFLNDMAFDKMTELMQANLTEHFFYVIAWMLGARRLSNKHFNAMADVFESDVISKLLVTVYGEMASKMTQNTRLLHSAIIAITEMLLTTREMVTVGPCSKRGISSSDVIEYRNISAQTFRLVFERDLWPKVLSGVLKNSHLSLEYLRAACSMAHAAQKCMSHYYKENNKSDELDIFERSLANDQILVTYTNLLKHRDDLTESELRWPLAYFNKMFAKHKVRGIFYNLQFVKSLNDLVTSNAIKRKFPALQKEYRSFFNFYTRRLIAILEEEPERYIELLFPTTINVRGASRHSSGPGQAHTTRSKYKFIENAGLTIEQRIGILVRIICEDGGTPQMEWLANRLVDVSQHKLMQAKNSQFKLLQSRDLESIYLSNDYLQLLLFEFGFRATSRSCTVPASVEYDMIMEYKHYVQKYMLESPDLIKPMETYLELAAPEHKDHGVRHNTEDGDSDMNMFVSDDDDDDEDPHVDINEMFNDRRFKSSGKKPHRKQTSTNRRNSQSVAKRSKNVRSSRFVDPADDETDEERDAAFFAKEQQQRETIGEENLTINDIPQNDASLFISQPSSDGPLTPPDISATNYGMDKKRPLDLDLEDGPSVRRRVKRMVIDSDEE